MKMKKIILSTILLGSSIFANNLNIGDENTLDEVTMCGINSKIGELDGNSAGIFYLYHKYSNLFEKVKNDEFELGDTAEKYSKIFKEKIKNSCSKVKDKEFVLNLNAEFEKYNFSKKGFPIDGMKKESYVEFYSSLSSHAKVIFDNVDVEKNFISMSKDKAKKFIKSKKRYGDVDRRIMAKYYFTINSIETPIDNVVSATANSYIQQINDEFIHGNITKVEFIDQMTQKVLALVKY
jgi:hypothetical protein